MKTIYPTHAVTLQSAVGQITRPINVTALSGNDAAQKALRKAESEGIPVRKLGYRVLYVESLH